MKQLIYLSPVPWSSFAQRPQKFVQWFHNRTGGEVIWVDPYPTRFPTFSDYSRLISKKNTILNPIPQWIRVIKPFSLPIEPIPFSDLPNFLFWSSILKELKAFSKNKLTLLVIGKPSLLAKNVLKKLAGIKSVYDAMDDFPEFYSGLSRRAMKNRERPLVRTVTYVLASSTFLLKRLGQMRSDVQFIPNGFDSNLLPTKKSFINNEEKKILGYLGTIGPWFDWEWAIHLAKLRPQDTIRLIGPIIHPPKFFLPKNIEIIPPCNQHQALEHMVEFDIGLIPFKKNNLTMSVDPIKYYEYRSLGLPILSTNFGEMVFHGKEEGVFISQGIFDVCDLVKRALLFKSNGESTLNFNNTNNWFARFDAARII